jgi:ABC transporter substrate binding protein
VPAVYAWRFQALSGALISYGVDLAESFRASASYVDRILRGEKPANLPVQAPTKFSLIVNLRTAKALGLEIPDKLLALADEVIEQSCCLLQCICRFLALLRHRKRADRHPLSSKPDMTRHCLNDRWLKRVLQRQISRQV